MEARTEFEPVNKGFADLCIALKTRKIVHHCPNFCPSRSHEQQENRGGSPGPENWRPTPEMSSKRHREHQVQPTDLVSVWLPEPYMRGDSGVRYIQWRAVQGLLEMSDRLDCEYPVRHPQTGASFLLVHLDQSGHLDR